MKSVRAVAVLVAWLSVPGMAAAQQASGQSLEISAGYAGFIDDALIDHAIVGGAWTLQVGRHVRIGPEAVYMSGPRGDRDLFLTGKVVVDFLPERPVSPYVVGDGGALFHRDLVGTGPYWSSEPAASGGAGVRVDVNDRLYIAPEFRIGWEPHFRIGVVVGWSFG